jgi:DNA polymerase-3 subunit delta
MAKAAAEKSAPLSAASRLVVLHGCDRYLADEHLRVLREALVKAHGESGVDTIRFDGNQGAKIIADLLDEARSFGLMRQHKILLVDNADILLKATEDDAPAAGRTKRGHAPQSARQLLESYTQDPSDAATIVLRANTWRPGNLDKAIVAMPNSAGSLIKCEAPSPAEITAWAQKRAKVRHNTSIDASTAAMLVDAVGTDFGRVDNELEKLALAAGGDRSPITADLVESMVRVSREDEFWSIQSALITGEAAAALAQLRDLIEVSRHDPVPITFSYVDMAKRVHLAARAQAGGTPIASIAPQLKIFGFGPARDAAIQSMSPAAQSAGVDGAAKLLKSAVATDAHNKSGMGEPVRNLEMLTIRFALATGRRRR